MINQSKYNNARLAAALSTLENNNVSLIRLAILQFSALQTVIITNVKQKARKHC